MSFRSIFIPALLLYFIALAVRLDGIKSLEPQPDETLWLRRSQQLLDTLHVRPSQATTHLGHPGIPPSATIAAALFLQKKLHDRNSQLFGMPLYFPTDLEAARFAVCVLNTLVVPFLFAGVYLLLGPMPALLAGIMVAFDPRLVGTDRLAHLDGMLTVFVTAALLAYAFAERNKRIGLKVLAGAFWGMAIATKITASMLVAGFISYRLVRSVCIRLKSGRLELPLDWGDVWAVITGHAVFALIYTRLWTHKSVYLLQHKVKSDLADFLWRCGTLLQAHYGLFVLAILLLGLLLLFVHRRSALTRSPLAQMALISVTLLTILFFVPQILENYARLWKFLFVLSGEPHEGLGSARTEAPPGYLILMLSHLPLMTALGVVLGFTRIAGDVLQGRHDERRMFLLLCAVCSVVWCLAFGVSSKQAWRYAAPIFPALAVLGAYGWLWIILYPFNQNAAVTSLSRTFGALAALIITCNLLYNLLVYRPHHQAYFSSVVGGLQGAIAHDLGYDFIGQREALKYLLDQRQNQPDPMYVTVFGSADSLAMTAQLYFGTAARKAFRFGYYARGVADYAIAFPSHQYLVEQRHWEDLLSLKPEYEYIFQGVPIVRVYRAPLPDLTKGLTYSVRELHSLTGSIRKDPASDRNILMLTPQKARPGFAFFTNGMNVPAGTIQISVEGRQTSPVNEAGDKEDALKLKVGECSRIVNLDEFPKDSVGTVSIDCHFQTTKKIFPEVEWNGKAPLVLYGLSIKKAE